MTNDPFLSTDACVARLLKEYEAHKRLIVAFDFDDTCFDYHGRGSNYDRVLNVLRWCKAHGFYLVMLTCSAKEKWNEQVDYMVGIGILVDSVNTNPIPLPFGHDGKPYYNILLDDRAGLGQAVETLEQVLKAIER